MCDHITKNLKLLFFVIFFDGHREYSNLKEYFYDKKLE